jgi:hypothetical protein
MKSEEEANGISDLSRKKISRVGQFRSVVTNRVLGLEDNSIHFHQHHKKPLQDDRRQGRLLYGQSSGFRLDRVENIPLEIIVLRSIFNKRYYKRAAARSQSQFVSFHRTTD